MNSVPSTILASYPSAHEVLPGDAEWVYLYFLLDPRDEAIRYIGQSASPASRFVGHLSDTRHIQGHTNGKKIAWVTELLSLNLRPRMIIVTEGPFAEILALEKRLIAEGLAAGQPLLNGRRPRGPNQQYQ